MRSEILSFWQPCDVARRGVSPADQTVRRVRLGVAASQGAATPRPLKHARSQQEEHLDGVGCGFGSGRGLKHIKPNPISDNRAGDQCCKMAASWKRDT